MPAVSTVPTSEIGSSGVESNRTGYVYQSSLHREDVALLRWPYSTRTYDRIRRTDSKVASSIRSMMLPIISAEWHIDPRGARPEVVERVADNLNLPILGQEDRKPARSRDRFDWPFHLRHALLSRVWGFTAFEQVYRVDDDGFAQIRKLAVRMPHTIDDLVVADDGGLIGIRQKPTGAAPRGPFIPIDRAVVYTFDREGYDWRGNSILRPIYREFLLKDHAHRVGAIHVERNGAGVVIVNDDPDAEDPQAEADANQKLASSVRAGSNAGGRLSAGAKAQIHGVTGETPDIIAFIRMYDEAIAQNVLDNFSSLPSAPNGSRALGTSMIDFFVRGLNAHAKDIATVCTGHVVEDLVDLNWGPDEPAPAVVCGEIGADQQPTAAALKMLVDAGVITPDAELEAWQRRYYGAPTKADGTADEPGAADGPVSPEEDRDGAPRSLTAAEVAQKVYLAVREDVVTRGEARRMIAEAGARLDGEDDE
ncbi:hypothetical protein [Euzebya sp.]|uniref:phage portal protein family protein n=1 Tax=Euzebya sp. TaxID=1971409 RepID=UPI003513D652